MSFRNLRSLARHADGWEPPMLVIAGLGVIAGLRMLAALLGIAQVRSFMLSTWLGWCFLGALISVAAGINAAQAIWRLGVLGWLRPRWWFEVGRLSWIASMVGIGSLAASLLLGGFAQAAWFATKCAFATFVLAASVGYLLSFLSRRCRTGRAYECVHFFYTTFGGIGLMGIAVYHWPPGNLWPAGAALMVFGITGLVLLVIGMITIGVRYEQNQVRRIEP